MESVSLRLYSDAYPCHRGARRFVHITIRTPDVSYTNHKNCNVSYTSFVKYRIYVAIFNEIVC